MKKVNTLCIGCLTETPFGAKLNVREGQWECPKCRHWNSNYFLAEESKPENNDSNHRDYNVGSQTTLNIRYNLGTFGKNMDSTLGELTSLSVSYVTKKTKTPCLTLKR